MSKYTTPGGGGGRKNKDLDFRWLLPSLPLERPAKQDLNKSIAFGCFGALIGVPRVMNCWFSTPYEKRDRKNQRDFTGDSFQVTASLFDIGMSCHHSIQENGKMGLKGGGVRPWTKSVGSLWKFSRHLKWAFKDYLRARSLKQRREAYSAIPNEQSRAFGPVHF